MDLFALNEKLEVQNYIPNFHSGWWLITYYNC